MVASADVLPEIVDRIVREFDPLKIILFGSQGRGDGSVHSDLDLLVVLPRVTDKAETNTALRRAISGVPVAVDVFVTDPDEIARSGDAVGSFVYPVLREGRVIYGVDERGADVWLRYAQEDLDAATRMVAGRGWAARIACFHAQQAAEKALEAVLVASGIPLQFTHNLELLRDLAPDSTRTSRLEVDLAALSRWAIVPRYPDAQPEASASDAQAGLAAAQAVVEAATEDVR